jgi:hypothetical protein
MVRQAIFDVIEITVRFSVLPDKRVTEEIDRQGYQSCSD